MCALDNELQVNPEPYAHRYETLIVISEQTNLHKFI